MDKFTGVNDMRVDMNMLNEFIHNYEVSSPEIKEEFKDLYEEKVKQKDELTRQYLMKLADLTQ